MCRERRGNFANSSFHIMPYGLWFFVCFGVCVSATYFSMPNASTNIPFIILENSLKRRILTHLYMQEDENEKNHLSATSQPKNALFLIEDNAIRLKPNFFKAIKETRNIKFEVTMNSEETAEVQVVVLDVDKFDCESFSEDLCFWRSVTYRIRENRGKSIIGSLSSPLLMELCDTPTVNYTLLTGSEYFELKYSPQEWVIQSRIPFDRETDGEYEISVECSLDTKNKLIRVQRNLTVEVLDEDDHLPVPQAKSLDIFLPDNKISKGQILEHNELIFTDKDSHKTNNYVYSIKDDRLKFLEPKCTKHENDRHKNVQTAVTCKIIATKDITLNTSMHSAVLEINDTNYLHQNHTRNESVGQLQIRIHAGIKTKPIINSGKRPLRQLLLYPKRNLSIFNTAAPYARITQPKDDPTQLRNFTLAVNGSYNDAFNITPDGIIYVQNERSLRKSVASVTLLVTWINGSVIESDEILVDVIKEPTETCFNVSYWKSCSEENKRKMCESSCGIASGGSLSVDHKRYGISGRCMWRGERNPGSIHTKIYSTCTPDIETCPDGTCDTLEQLNDYICPQDCTQEVNFPTIINPTTKRGIVAEAGICSCDKFLRCSCSIRPTVTSTLVPVTQKIYKSTAQNAFNDAKSHSGPTIFVCGTTCMLSTTAAGVFLLGMAGFVVVCWRSGGVRKFLRRKFPEEAPDLSAPLSEYVDRSVVVENIMANHDSCITSNTKFTVDSKWEFPRDKLIVQQTLGEGEFGRVLIAKALDISDATGFTTVAVKTVKENASESELADLMSEYELLKGVSHPNVIRLLGASTTTGGPPYVIIEYAEHGSLRNYLRKSRRLLNGTVSNNIYQTEHYEEPNCARITPQEILSFGWQICNGMTYLAGMKLVHRDLAARNVLLTAEKVCKISDFGLTRDIYEDDAYLKRSKGRVPVKWMAPESLADHIYTTKSDVWSFGILIWELVTLGASPYPGIEVQNLFHLLKTGYRMERPENCSLVLYGIMKKCWELSPERRPSFRELKDQWENLLSEGVNYLDLSGNAFNNLTYFSVSDANKPDNTNTNPNTDSTNEETEKKTEKNLDSLQTNTVQNDYEKPNGSIMRIPTPSNEFPQYYANMNNKLST